MCIRRKKRHLAIGVKAIRTMGISIDQLADRKSICHFFLTYAINGVPSEIPEWLNTVSVSYGGAVDLILDFTDPVIRGVSVFHCHLLSHEDKGMMAKIVFE